MPREGRPMYQRPDVDQTSPSHLKALKQEYHDPVYEHNTMVGGAASQASPSSDD